MEEYEESKDAVIKELKRLVETYSRTGEPPPHAIGGPYDLTPEEMLREVETNTELGRKIVAAFSSLRRQFPSNT
ncbi:hypothetical protein KA005_64210 [bacterium]|nr:hypothetical protein [bacterium]